MRHALLRAATEDDLAFMVGLGAIMHAKTGLDVPYEPLAAAKAGQRCIREGACFVTERGMIGGLDVPLMYGATPALSQVVFWYSEDGQAFALLRAFEDWAALPISVATFDERMRRVLSRRGYRLAEGTMLWVR